jgi:hypothetical protein
MASNKFAAGVVEVRTRVLNGVHYAGVVIEHHHGDGRWHWSTDLHTDKTGGSDAHAALAGVKVSFAAGMDAADKALYRAILKDDVTRIQVRKGINRQTAVVATPVATPVDLMAELVELDALAGASMSSMA